MKTPLNYLSHNINVNDATGNYEIKIRLSDPCKNGHNDFAITATFYEIGKGRSDRNMICGGCCHDEILKVRPDLKLFVDLHLADVNGAPMYATGNGFYHLQNSEPKVAQEYVRATAEEFKILSTAPDEMYFTKLLFDLGIVKRWKNEAKSAISQLEVLTGERFEDNSKKLQSLKLGTKAAKEIKNRIETGYYTEDQTAKRKIEQIAANKQAALNEIIAERDKEIKKATDEFIVKRTILEAGLPLDNFIFYTHTMIGCFNWKDYDKKITKEEFDKFVESVDFNDMPSGLKFTFGEKK